MTAPQKKRLAGGSVIASATAAAWIVADFYASPNQMQRFTPAIICVGTLVACAYLAALARSN